MKLTWECKELTVSVSCKEDRIDEDMASLALDSCASLLSRLIHHMDFGDPEYVIAVCLEDTATDYSEEICCEVDRLRLEMVKAAQAYRIARDEELADLEKRAEEILVRDKGKM